MPLDKSPGPHEGLYETLYEAAVGVRGLLSRAKESAADHIILAALRHGSPHVIILPEGEYEAFMATLELEEDEEALDDLRAGQEETRQGLPPTWEELEGELGPLGSTQAHKTV